VTHQRDAMLRFIASAIHRGVYFHDYGGAACHHGFCAAMTMANVDDALNRLDGRGAGDRTGRVRKVELTRRIGILQSHQPEGGVTPLRPSWLFRLIRGFGRSRPELQGVAGQDQDVAQQSGDPRFEVQDRQPTYPMRMRIRRTTFGRNFMFQPSGL